MATLCPLMSGLFTRIHQGIKQSETLLVCESNLNQDQLKAVNQIACMPPRSIEHNDDDDEKEDVEDAMREQWEIGTKVQIYSVSNKRWIDGEIINIIEDDEGEWVEVKYGHQTKQVGRYSDVIRAAMDTNNKLALQSRALVKSSIENIDVTKSMEKEFNQKRWQWVSRIVVFKLSDRKAAFGNLFYWLKKY